MNHPWFPPKNRPLKRQVNRLTIGRTHFAPIMTHIVCKSERFMAFLSASHLAECEKSDQVRQTQQPIRIVARLQRQQFTRRTLRPKSAPQQQFPLKRS